MNTDTDLYWCPVSGDMENRNNGGFDVCCDRVDKHIKNPYVVLITGSRTWPQPLQVEEDLLILKALWGNRLMVRHGKCPNGADDHAKLACEEHGIAQDSMPADWKQFGKRAGYVRNYEMVHKVPRPPLCIAYIHNNSRGATMCAELAKKENIYVLPRMVNDV